MGLRHRSLPVFGVQFHPESIASQHGHALLANFLAMRAGRKRARPRRLIAALAAAGMSSNLKPVLARLAMGETLDEDEAEDAFGIIMAGEATPAQIAGLLMAMRVRGETVAEMTGAVRAMRARMSTVEAPPDAIDVVGTGGDNAGSLNISTAVAFVLAGMRRAGREARQPRPEFADRGRRRARAHSASTLTSRSIGCPPSSARAGARSCSPRVTTPPSGMRQARASNSEPGRSSTCSARWRIRPGCAGSSPACSPPSGCGRWPRRWDGSGPRRPGSCMARGSMSSRSRARTSSLRGAMTRCTVSR